MEKYGTIPKRFSRAWWSYFWEYYKWHTLGTLFAVILIITTAVQCANKIDYDLYITYAGSLTFAEESINNISSSLSEIIADTNADNEQNVYFQQLNIGNENPDPQYEMAMSTKLMLEFSAGESFIFIMSKDLVNTYLNGESYDSLFLPVSEWASVMPDDSQVSKADGVPYAVSLSGCTYFEQLGLNLEEQYLLIRNPRNSELEDEELNLQFENAKTAANLIIEK